MKRAIYILMITCSLVPSACMDDTPSPQTGNEPCRLTPRFMQGGSITDSSSAKHEARALVTGIGTSGDGNISEIGVCITGTGHNEYKGMESNGTRYLFKTTDATTWTCYQGDNSSSSSPFSFILNGENATLQAFHPAASTVTELTLTSGSVHTYTIPVTILATQTFAGDKGSECGTTDYLYGSKTKDRGSAETITANALNASPTIYMQHALAQVAFKIQYAADRTPDNEHDCVKSVQLTSSTNRFKVTQTDGAGTMQINDGTLGNLTATGTLTFNATSNTEIPVGNNGSPSVVAYGLVAPIAKPDGTITLNITLGKKGDTTYDRTYTATTTAFNVAWEKGYCYNYNLVLGNNISITQSTVTWENIESSITVTTQEQGIASAEELAAFAQLWNEKGKNGNDYSIYEKYGWTEKDENGASTFKIKLVGPITLTGTKLEDIQWEPIGTETNPLAIPFDGQGWTINIDLTGLGTGTGGTEQKIPGKYAGIIGNSISDISNVKVMTSGAASAVAIEFTEAVYAGILAGKVQGNITNCSAELNNITLLQSNRTSNESLYFGGLAGSCTGNIINSAVYAKATNELKLSYAKAYANSCIGGLAGSVNGKVENCYTRINELSNQDNTNGNPAAGSLVGNKTSTTFSNCHYIEDTTGGSGMTVTNCTREEPDTGVTPQADYTGLCDALNTIAQENNWSTWTEEIPQNTTTVTSVYLFNYRNKTE